MKRIVFCLSLLLAACGEERRPWLGYVEGEFVRVGSPLGGRLERLSVQRGQTVATGTGLFTLEHALEQAALSEAEHRLAATRTRIEADRSAARQLAALEAQMAQAESALRLAQATLERRQQLVRDGAVSREALDQARADRDAALARVAEVDAQMRAAFQDVAAAEAAVAQARWQLEQKSAAAAGPALVEETYFREGEWVPPGTPIVSLLPPENRVVRFYVGQAEVAGMQPGQAVQVRCDGCGAPIPARVSFVAPEAEFTPPVIYSQDQRARLVFRVEARVAAVAAARLPPGLPVEVEPAGE